MDSTRDEEHSDAADSGGSSSDSREGGDEGPSFVDGESYTCINVIRSKSNDEEPSFLGYYPANPDKEPTPSSYDMDSLIECIHLSKKKSHLKLVAEVAIIGNNNEGRIAAMLEEHERQMNKDIAPIVENTRVGVKPNDQIDLTRTDNLIEEIEVCEEQLYNSMSGKPIEIGEERLYQTVSRGDTEVHDEEGFDISCEASEGLKEGHSQDKQEEENNGEEEDDDMPSFTHVEKGDKEDFTQVEEESVEGGSIAYNETHTDEEGELIQDNEESDEEENIQSDNEQNEMEYLEMSDGDKPVEETFTETTSESVEDDNEDSEANRDDLSNDTSSCSHQEQVDKLLAESESEDLITFEDNNEDSTDSEAEKASKLEMILSSTIENQWSCKSNENVSFATQSDNEDDSEEKIQQDSNLVSASTRSLIVESVQSMTEQEQCNTVMVDTMDATEVNRLMQEKDAEIEEARWQAARYADLGRKQVASLKRQIEEISQKSDSAVNVAIEEAVASSTKLLNHQKDLEFQKQISAIRNAYESKIEKITTENAEKVKAAAESATRSTTANLMENIAILEKQLETERATALQTSRKQEKNFRDAINESKGAFDGLAKERKSIAKLLEYAEAKIMASGANVCDRINVDDMKPSSRYFEFDSDPGSLTDIEKKIVHVFQCYALVIESRDAERENLNLTKCQKEAELDELKTQNKLLIQSNFQLKQTHSSEIEKLQQQCNEADNRIQSLRTELETFGREKQLSEDKLRKAVENHRSELEKLESRLHEAANGHSVVVEKLEDKYRDTVNRHLTEVEQLEKKYHKSIKDHGVDVEKLQNQYRKAVEDRRVDVETLDEKWRTQVKTHQADVKRLEEQYRTAVQNHQKELKWLEDRYRKATEQNRTEIEKMQAERTGKLEAEITTDGYKASRTNPRSDSSEVSSETECLRTIQAPAESKGKRFNRMRRDMSSEEKESSPPPLLKTFRPAPILVSQEQHDQECDDRHGLATQPPPSPRYTSVRSFFENSRSLQAITKMSIQQEETNHSIHSQQAPCYLHEVDSPKSKILKSNPTVETLEEECESLFNDNDSHSLFSKPSAHESFDHKSVGKRDQPPPTIKLRKTWIRDKKTVSPIHDIITKEDDVPSPPPSPLNLGKPPLPILGVGRNAKSPRQCLVVDGKQKGSEKTDQDKMKQAPLSVSTTCSSNLGRPTPTKSSTNHKKATNRGPKSLAMDAIHSTEGRTSARKPRDDEYDVKGMQTLVFDEPFEPIEFSSSFPGPESQHMSRIPLTLSASIDSAVSSVDSMEENRPSLAHGHQIFRQPSLSAFSPPKEFNQSSSSTTTSPTKTQKSAPAPPLLSTTDKRPAKRSHSAKDSQLITNSATTQTARRATNFASMRSRRLSRRFSNS